jgi:hypothetical protein
LGLNAIPLFFAAEETWFPIAVGLAAVYLPARFMNWLKGDES